MAGHVGGQRAVGGRCESIVSSFWGQEGMGVGWADSRLDSPSTDDEGVEWLALQRKGVMYSGGRQASSNVSHKCFL